MKHLSIAIMFSLLYSSLIFASEKQILGGVLVNSREDHGAELKIICTKVENRKCTTAYMSEYYYSSGSTYRSKNFSFQDISVKKTFKLIGKLKLRNLPGGLFNFSHRVVGILAWGLGPVALVALPLTLPVDAVKSPYVAGKYIYKMSKNRKDQKNMKKSAEFVLQSKYAGELKYVKNIVFHSIRNSIIKFAKGYGNN